MSFDLVEYADRSGVTNPEKFAQKCETLRLFLIEANRNVNLTRITEKEDFEIKHVADSLSILQFFPEIAQFDFRIADIGCGAGFPSLILALACPNLKITSIDSTGKKIAFVAQAAQHLGLKNLQAIQGRALELNRKKDFQGKFDIITARAVAPSPKIYRETDRFVNDDGRYIFYKTPTQAAEEMPELLKIKQRFWHTTDEFTLPNDSGLRLFVVGN